MARTRTFLACAFVAASLAAQISQFGETIDVKVINVDAVVTSPDGVPIRGLAADEFELRVDGKPVEITYYSAVEDGWARADGATSRTDSPVGDEALPFLAIAWDQRSFRPREAQLVLEALVEELPRLIASSRGILVARQGDRLGIEQSFTRDPALLHAALERLTKKQVVSSSRGERSLLMSRIEQAPRLEDAFTDEQARLIQDRAEVLLQEIGILAEQERHEAIAGLGQLQQLVDLLSNLPRRKSVLYIGRGIRTQPADPVYRLWWRKYGSIGARMAAPDVQSLIDHADVTTKLGSLIRNANSQRVAFYAHDTGGAKTIASSVEFSSLGAATATRDESLRQQKNLQSLATATGGLVTINNNSLDPLVGGMLRDFRSYYSLGFEATSDLPERGRISIRVRGGELRVRHFDRFDLESIAGDLERATMTALMTDEVDNPLDATLEIGEVEQRKNGALLVPILVKVPISRLALLPQDEQHVGKLSIVVLAKSSDGDLSQPAHGEVPIAIENTELLAAMGRLAGYRLRMQVSPGEQAITIGLRDEVARTLSTLHVVLDNGKDT